MSQPEGFAIAHSSLLVVVLASSDCWLQWRMLHVRTALVGVSLLLRSFSNIQPFLFCRSWYGRCKLFCFLPELFSFKLNGEEKTKLRLNNIQYYLARLRFASIHHRQKQRSTCTATHWVHSVILLFGVLVVSYSVRSAVFSIPFFSVRCLSHHKSRSNFFVPRPSEKCKMVQSRIRLRARSPFTFELVCGGELSS